MASAGNWCLIESDPGVFTELIHDIGVPDVQVEELYNLDTETLSSLAPVYGLVFLFKWTAPTGEKPVVIEHGVDGLFFASQVIQNACATQAILSILLNSPVNLGPDLSEFKEFTLEFPAEMRGLAISNQEKIRTVHNSFSRQECFSMESTRGEKEDAFHFVAYIPYRGRVYELDGLQRGPIDHGAAGDDWLNRASAVIQERIAKYAGAEIRFNLMAVVKDRKKILHEKIQRGDAQLAQLASTGDDGQLALQMEVQQAREDLANEEEKTRRYKIENNRRKHNYIPLFLEMLKILARNKQLDGLVEKAKAKAKAAASKPK